MIIKTLILSQVVHLFGTTFTPKYILEQLDKIIFNFLLNHKPPRVKRETVIAPIDSGGLKMPEVFVFQEAQKISNIIKSLSSKFHQQTLQAWFKIKKQTS